MDYVDVKIIARTHGRWPEYCSSWIMPEAQLIPVALVRKGLVYKVNGVSLTFGCIAYDADALGMKVFAHIAYGNVDYQQCFDGIAETLARAGFVRVDEDEDA